ncbi:glycosyltransferase family 4 protein [Roseivirga misakiensis]|uniref:Glycosyl transferase family 1 domain-containing protein n=1 Tax=Roseivirga misakiensis TaxID=1563681 RepID=A0A1E5T1F8_9BACT|nr:glycosyltransferase family 4 protein [Roseivirga misakiensis]OEK05213.1 hypothetical protein BFP71_17575 [Roseivirga misakiensis]
MKIVFAFHDRANYAGGPALNAVRLLPELQNLGIEVHGICIAPKDLSTPNAQSLIDNGVKVTVLNRKFFSEELAYDVWTMILSIDPDVVVSNINIQTALLAKWLVKRGIPVIHTHRSDDELNNGVADFLLSSDNGWDVQGYMFVNEFLKKKYNNSLSAQSILNEVIYSGVLPSDHRADLESGQIGIIYSGRIEEIQKRILGITESFIHLSGKYPDMKFTMIGGGSLYGKVREAIELAQSKNKVSLEKNLYGQAYKKKLSEHHFVFLNSEYEGTPGSLMDGMSCGLIPISTRYEGVEEIISDGYNGFIIDHISELENLILRVSKDRIVMKQMSARNVEMIDSKFSVRVSAQKWYGLISSLNNKYPKKPKSKADYNFQLPHNHKSLREHNSWSNRSLLRRVFYKLRILYHQRKANL